MSAKVAYVDRVLGFLYEQGFARKFEDLGSPAQDLELWYRNAQVYEEVTKARKPRMEDRVRLTTLIEAVRFESLCPPFPGDPQEFDVSAYEFSEDVLAYKSAVIEAVLRQEAKAPSFFEPPSSDG